MKVVLWTLNDCSSEEVISFSDTLFNDVIPANDGVVDVIVDKRVSVKTFTFNPDETVHIVQNSRGIEITDDLQVEIARAIDKIIDREIMKATLGRVVLDQSDEDLIGGA